MSDLVQHDTSSDMRPVEITPTIRVVTTDREWIVQTADTKRSRRRAARRTGEWADHAYLTGRSMLNRELKRLVGNGAIEGGLKGLVSQDVLDWLNGLPARHPARDTPKTTAAQPTVLDMLEAKTTADVHDSLELRSDLPLIVKHGPLKYRNHWNARFDAEQ